MVELRQLNDIHPAPISLLSIRPGSVLGTSPASDQQSQNNSNYLLFSHHFANAGAIMLSTLLRMKGGQPANQHCWDSNHLLLKCVRPQGSRLSQMSYHGRAFKLYEILDEQFHVSYLYFRPTSSIYTSLNILVIKECVPL